MESNLNATYLNMKQNNDVILLESFEDMCVVPACNVMTEYLYILPNLELDKIDELLSKEDVPNINIKEAFAQVNELYEEMLFLLLSTTNEAEVDDKFDILVKYIQDVFGVTPKKHFEMLKKAQTKQPQKKTLRLVVDKAENLFSMDSNGLSDPFVTVYIESNSASRYNTTVAPSTLNPSWKEHFIIPLPRSPLSEILVIEVWDFDAAESVGEKMTKLVEVKGIRGIRKLLKEIALTASTGKHDNELIGRTDIPLKSIPPHGIKSWYTLKKGSNNKNRGSILLHIYLLSGKNKMLAINEHRNLLKIFLLHELKFRNTIPFKWCGVFSDNADTIIGLHYTQNNFSELDSGLCQWDVYSLVHKTHFLSLQLFSNLLRKLLPVIKGKPKWDESVNIAQFWEGYKGILPSCFVIVRSIRSDKFEEAYGIDNFKAALEIIKKAEPPATLDNIDLFPPHVYEWLGKSEGQLNADIVLTAAIKLSSSQFFDRMYGNSRALSDNTIQHLILVIRSLINDLQVAAEYYDKFFLTINDLKYGAVLYNLYRQKVEDLFFPKITYICNNLDQLNCLDDEVLMASATKDFKSGMLLFELYLCFKRFTNLGSALSTNVDGNKFYEYFYPAVVNWLNITVIKTLTRIEKAVELDNFCPYNNVLKYTSSALDILSLFYQVKYFWEQLDWPKIEESYLFIEKIVNDVCRCSIFYATKMCQRIFAVNGQEATQKISHRSEELCYVVNDFNYIRESLPLFIKELHVNDILKKLAEIKSPLEAERCSVTINNIICNAVDIIESKALEIIELLVHTIKKITQKLLTHISSTEYGTSDHINQLLKYYHKYAEVFLNELQKENLEKLMDIICIELSTLFHECIEVELNKCHHPLFFGNMQSILEQLVEILTIQTNDMIRMVKLKEICSFLKLLSMDTENIINQYYEDQLLSQKINPQNTYGQLSIKANLSNNILEVHILNGYQLLPKYSESSCNTYVKVHFVPANNFIGIQSLKTSVQHRTRCPLYDELFFINLSEVQFKNRNNVLVFCVKNKDFFGLSNQYIAECYLSFADIENSNNAQNRLNLSKPQYLDNNIIHILTTRTEDKQAKVFLKKLKQKSLDYKKIYNHYQK